jgi:4'-phosphopantetheinyl transferase EntD
VTGTLHAILPAGAVGVERGSIEAEAVSRPMPSLFAVEETLVASASDGRRREFAEGRACAREALEALGVEPGPIPGGADGAPVWPEGVLGSITHKGGYRAAAVALALASDLRGLGIDAEPDEPLPAGVLEAIAFPAELAAVIELLEQRPGPAWDRLLFGAKEAAVKAVQPLGLGVVGVRSVEVSFDRDGRSFAAQIDGPEARGIAGAWGRSAGLLLTAANVT